MSILINGMEMPEKGEYRMTLYVCDDGYAYIDVDLFPVDKDRFEAAPVPPHGRLGDLDALIDKVIAKYLEHERKGELVFAAAEIKQDIVDLISDAPTIIPAEDGET